MLLLTYLLVLTSFTDSLWHPNAPAPTPLFLSTDDGNNWRPLVYGLPEGTMPRRVLDHDGTLYLATESAGLFALPKDAQEWESRGTGLPPGLPILTLAGQGSALVLGTYGRGVYVSHDGGDHWRQPVFNIRSESVLDLLFYDNMLLAATDSGLWRSYDLGETWHQDCNEHTVFTQLTVYRGELYIARQNGIGRVSGLGISWADVHTETSISQLYTAGDYLYASTADGTVFRSQDGKRWMAAPAPVSPPAELPAGQLIFTSRGWIASVSPGC